MTSPLGKKLQLKPGFRCALIGAPEDYTLDLPGGAVLAGPQAGGLDFVQAFVRDLAEVDALAPRAIAAVRRDGLLWLTYPKGGKTDVNRDRLWERMQALGWAGVALVSVDATWSAMRFRPAELAGR